MDKMKFVVWKFDLTDGGKIEMPRGSKVLTVQVQRSISDTNRVVLWAECNPDELEKEVRTFAVVPTGVPMEQHEKRFIATFQDGWFVGHVFEVQ